MRLFSRVALAAIFSASFALAGPPEESLILRVHVQDRDADLRRLAALQLDLAGVDAKAQTADFVGDRDTYDLLFELGFFPQVVRSTATLAPEALSQYLDPTEVVAKLDQYQATYPALAKKVAVAVTAEGRTEWALKISDNVNLDEDEPTILYVGQHHAREVMTTEITIDIIDYLLTRYATDAQVQRWVDGREIWVVPSHNPDGTNTVFTTNANWRKNRRNNGGGSFGVDLNRNYPKFWSFCASGGGASSATTSDTYRGPSPASEPETQGILALASAQKPVVSLSYHTYSELVIHPYGCEETTNSETRMLSDYSSDIAARIRNDANDGWYSNGTPWELLYEVSGEADEQLYADLGVTPTTIEANSSTQGFQPDYNTWRATTVQRNRAGWQFLLDRPDGPSIWGHTTNACTGAPLSAGIALDEVVFANGETPRTSEPIFGRYQWLTIPGSYHLRATKPGFGTQVWPVDVRYAAQQREVRLVPTGSFAAEPLATAIDDSSGDRDQRADPGESLTLAVTAVATGGTLNGLTAVLSSSDPYVTILDANGAWPSIPAGASAASTNPFSFVVSPSAPDGHVATFTLQFTAFQSLCAAASTVEIPLDAHAPLCPLAAEPLDTNPGWTIAGGASGWAFGAPYSGNAGGPTAAHSGANVYGTNLLGNYANSADERLVTTPFDLTGVKNAELSFWRWLDNEAGFDIASIDLSTDGTNFTNVWSGFGRDTGWQLYRYDISALADGQPTVYVRFRLQSDASTAAAGFYIDDVSICGDTLATAPRLSVVATSIDDSANPACGDGDAYADPGEAVDLTVHVRNDGNAVAAGVVARLTSPDSRVGMAAFRTALGDLAPGTTTPATFRITLPSNLACQSPLEFVVVLEATGGLLTVFDVLAPLTGSADDGAPVPDAFDSFEAPSGWALTGEWQIAPPSGLGGTAGAGLGSPDPSSAFSGTKVLGVDLTGLGSRLGNYENSVSTAITATSPAWDCGSSGHVDLSFKRWLGVERGQYDQAGIDAWDGSAWQGVWQNPDSYQSDSAWQSVAYDVSRWAAGNPAFRVRFRLTSDGGAVFSGWNVDDLRVTNGRVPRVCEGAPCTAGCTPTAEAAGLTFEKQSGTAILDWSSPADPCLATSGATYRVYRSEDPRPRTQPATAWPQDSFFTDVTTNDLDGTASNTTFTDPDTPGTGTVFFYLAVPMGTNGQEGPNGWDPGAQ